MKYATSNATVKDRTFYQRIACFERRCRVAETACNNTRKVRDATKKE